MDPDRRPVAELMAETLEDDFGLVTRWRETESRNTYENAVFSNRLLREAGIRHVYLVTHALYMKRARDVFAATGLEVIPAPVGVYDPKRRWVLDDLRPGRQHRRDLRASWPAVVPSLLFLMTHITLLPGARSRDQ